MAGRRRPSRVLAVDAGTPVVVSVRIGAPLSSHGDYGPLLLLESSASLPPPLAEYLSDIEPGYTNAIRPVREVYNHGWLLGDERSISAVAQAEVDALLEIAPRTSAQEPSVSPPE